MLIDIPDHLILAAAAKLSRPSISTVPVDRLVELGPGTYSPAALVAHLGLPLTHASACTLGHALARVESIAGCLNVRKVRTAKGLRYVFSEISEIALDPGE